jgi:hypothetical protein
MPIIQDPDLLNQGTEVVFNTTNKTIQLLVAGNLSTDGVTLQALYSFTKEEWKNDNTLIKYVFPFIAITPEQFEFVNGWTPADTTTINLLRSAGFAIKNTNGTSAAEYAGVITLGSIGSSDQCYYTQSLSGSSTNIVRTGAVNQTVKIYGDSSNGNFDYRSYFKLFVRNQGKSYGSSSLVDIGVSTLTYQAYRFPLANQTDSKITHTDIEIVEYGVTINYYSTNQSRSINGTSYNFNTVIDGNDKTAEEIYEAVQLSLRSTNNINANTTPTVIGNTGNSLLTFLGDTLVTANGVYIDNFQTADINRIDFYDVNGIKRIYPFITSGLISFNSNLVSDGFAVYKMFYSDNFGTNSAALVLDMDNNPIQGSITGSTVSFTYDYDNDITSGGAGVNKAITVVAIGLNTAQYVLIEGTITRSNQNSISLVSSLERNYTNV